MGSRPRFRVLPLLVVVALGLAGAFGVQRVRGPQVTTVAAARREVVQTVVASGRVRVPSEVGVATTIAGLVRAVNAREGERVRLGDVLVQLDDAELAAQVAQARAGVLLAASRAGSLRQVNARVAGESVRQGEANLRAAEQTLARQRALHASGALSAAELESAERSVEVARSQLASARITAAGTGASGGEVRAAEATLAQARAALQLAEVRLAQARVTAPASGVIVRREVEPGDVAAAGRVLLALIVDGPAEVQITPDERNLADLRLGQRALVSAEAFPNERFAAVVSYFAPVIDAQRGTVEVRLRVPDPPSYLRPAMTVSVEVEVARRAGLLTVPQDAVRDASTPRPWVMVVDAEGRARRRDVRVGLRGAEVIEVVAGLREGERVIPGASGSAQLLGRRVRAQGGG